MRGIIPNLSIAPSREPPAERTEPRLLPVNAPLLFRHPAAPDPGILFAAREDDPKPAMGPAPLVADRRPAAPASRPVRALPFVVIAALIALGAAAGVGSLMFRAPSGETVSAPKGTVAEQRQTTTEPGPTPPEAATPHPAASAATPSLPPAQPAADNTETKSQGNVAQAASPTTPSAPPPKSAAPAPGPASKAVTPQVAEAAKIAAQPAPATGDSPGGRPAVRHSRGDHRPAHPRVAERHVLPRSRSEVRLPAPRTLSTQSATQPQPDQAASFGRLVTQLTAPTKSIDQSLSPPAPDAADPFAAPASTIKSDQ
jgi:hypothetical protein